MIPGPLVNELYVPSKDLLSFIFESMPQGPNCVQYIDADNERNFLTYSQVLTMVQRIGGGLKNLGVRDGDVVLGFSPNSIMYPCMIYGVICAGAIFTGANHSYTARELEYQIVHSGAKFVLLDPDLLPIMLEVAEKLSFDKGRIITTKPVHGFESLESIISMSPAVEWQRVTDPELLRSRTCIILYSSGTTGLPKGVELSHYNIIANTLQVAWFTEQGNEALTREGLPPLIGAMVGHLPMYHAYGLAQICNIGMRTGTCFVVMRKFDLMQMLAIIQKYRVSVLITVPPVMTLLAKSPIVARYDLSSLRAIRSGAAPLGAKVQDALRARIGRQCRFQQGYGMSEATCTMLAFTTAEDDRTGSVGYLCPGTHAKLIDEAGEVISAANTHGELCIRGPQVMKGYLNNPEATQRTIIDGWLHTGDVAMHAEGLLYIVDRKKELIKYKGLQVAPAELEAVLLSHVGIADAAAVGVPFHEDEAPRVFIVLAEGSETLTEQDIWTWLEHRVARYKLPRAGIIFTSSIPKSPSGKLLRRVIKEQARSQQVDMTFTSMPLPTSHVAKCGTTSISRLSLVSTTQTIEIVNRPLESR